VKRSARKKVVAYRQAINGTLLLDVASAAHLLGCSERSLRARVRQKLALYLESLINASCSTATNSSNSSRTCWSKKRCLESLFSIELKSGLVSMYSVSDR